MRQKNKVLVQDNISNWKKFQNGCYRNIKYSKMSSTSAEKRQKLQEIMALLQNLSPENQDEIGERINYLVDDDEGEDENEQESERRLYSQEQQEVNNNFFFIL